MSRWPKREPAPVEPLITPEELHRLADARLARDKAEWLRVARNHRALQAEAKAAGDKTIAMTLGLLAANLEKAAALAEAERSDRAAKLKGWQRRLNSREAAKAPRPGRRPALRELIADMMQAERRAGVDFKTFLRRWESEPLGELGLAAIDGGKRYTVTDESGDAGCRTYTAGYVEKLYSASAKTVSDR